MTNLDSMFKSRDITFPTKVRLIKAMVFPKSWTIKKAVPPGLRVLRPPPLPHRGPLPAGRARGRAIGVLRARVRGVAGRPRRPLSRGGGAGHAGPGGREAGGACLSWLSHASAHVSFPLPQPMGGGRTARRRPRGPCTLPFFKNKEKKKKLKKKKKES